MNRPARWWPVPLTNVHRPAIGSPPAYYRTTTGLLLDHPLGLAWDYHWDYFTTGTTLPLGPSLGSGASPPAPARFCRPSSALAPAESRVR